MQWHAIDIFKDEVCMRNLGAACICHEYPWDWNGGLGSEQCIECVLFKRFPWLVEVNPKHIALFWPIHTDKIAGIDCST